MNTVRLKHSLLLTALTLAQVALCGSAQATLLQGHIEHATAGSTASFAAQVEQDRLKVNTFPSSYAGTWHCVTTVTDSAVSDVAPGTVTQCDIEFKSTSDGRIMSHWFQPGWTEGQSEVVSFSTTEAQLDRTAYYTASSPESSWAARSRETFNLTSGDEMTSSSYVDQYIQGQYIGRYRTSSVLHKEGSTAATAMLPTP
ncbi:MAG TPA: hypothetical protein V6C81_15770 [Planktothrix sp.]|jgi:hypothetical protein